MIPLSVIVITKNEAHNIEACLQSVSWCTDVIVVDAESKDGTADLAKKYTQKVFVQPWLGFAAAKQFAMKHVVNDWVLWLDADERVQTASEDEITTLLASHPQQAAFSIGRRAYFLGRWIKHSGWYPGYVPRLFHKDRAEFNSAAVHEGLMVHGTIGTLKNDLLHFTDPTIYHYFTKLNRYTDLASIELQGKGKRTTIADLLIRPWWQFIRMYIVKLGFLDGIQGLLLALFSSGYVFTKYSKLYEFELSKNKAE